jgi:dolichyl-phosphate-mannose-protein mannosyltransferase
VTDTAAPLATVALVSDRPRWSVLDTVLVAGITALASVLRLAHITRPSGFVFDEFYASDACLYLRGPSGGCMTATEISVAHPPLAKWLIAVGIRLFGFNPAGWRFAPFVAGTLSVAVLYLLARRLLGSTPGAALAAVLLTFDFLHFVMSRTAMLDVFVVLFGLTAFVCLLYDRDRTAVPRTGFPAQVWARPWLLGAGLAAGAAVACKWSGVYVLVAVAVLASLSHTAGSGARDRRRPRQLGLLLLAFVALPVAVYVGSYAGRLDGAVLAWPWANGSWVRAFVSRQAEMLAHHTGTLYTHPYASAAWSWPLVKRPVLFYVSELPGGAYQEILALGNPLVWWPGLVAVVMVAWRVLRRATRRGGDAVLVLGFVAGYIPWLVITRREAFLYYFLPAVPFLYLALAGVVTTVAARVARAVSIGLVIVGAVAPFAFFWPLLTAAPMSHMRWERRLWFRDCAPIVAPGRPGEPMTKVGTRPPAGWCWM